MTPLITQTSHEDFGSVEKRSKYTVNIVGCNHEGVLHACLFAEAGFRIVCTDTDPAVLSNITKGKIPYLRKEYAAKLRTHMKNGYLNVSNDIVKSVSESDVVVLAVPCRIDEKKKTDYSNMERILKGIGRGLRAGSIVMVVVLVGIGVTEGLIRETLENSSGLKGGPDFGLAYTPNVAVPCQGIMGAVDERSLNVALNILQSIGRSHMRKAGSIKIAEAATLFEVSWQTVDTALANEFAMMCEKSGLDYFEVVGLSGGYDVSRSRSFICQNENIFEGSCLLLENAENLNVKSHVLQAAQETNEDSVKHALSLVCDALKNCGKTLRRSRISIFGISRIRNTKCTPKTAAVDIAHVLGVKGAKVRVYDPHLSENEVEDMQFDFKKALSEAAEGADCILILTGHDQFRRLDLGRLKILMRMPAAIVDLEGIIDPKEAEREGFIYRGLGRGVWTK